MHESVMIKVRKYMLPYDKISLFSQLEFKDY